VRFFFRFGALVLSKERTLFSCAPSAALRLASVSVANTSKAPFNHHRVDPCLEGGAEAQLAVGAA